ncbi:amine oxidase [Thecamonas trahens ATCC 50062]|uniref:Amine oxidase n=1 Tax=Thecamonas trahens ATCC 50062 TaxID=461836 RepID=A0A0L0DF38_THETB|nr:amine oxidase [Thecamonas trahens ATCC 50062]KNC50756.1 amine oxidase [Thecamonas trahens ATCC 50062]|eukprot:XP_013756719.1 amine oxidase [Thecamonas trahens ATCC 50062]
MMQIPQQLDLLANGHEVTLFESLAEVGMGAHAHTVETADGQVTVDVPFRVFNERHYRNFAAILTSLGIEWEMCNYAASYSALESGEVYFRYANWLIGAFSLPYLPFASLFSTSGWAVAKDFYRWISSAKLDLDAGRLDGLTMGEYLDSRGYSDLFQHRVFFPIMAIIMTCDIDSMRQYPADMVVGAFTNGRGRGVKRALGGTDAIVAALSANIANVHCSAAVTAVKRGCTETKPVVEFSIAGGDAQSVEFDHVIIATQPEHVLKLLQDPSPELKSILSLWGSETSDVVVHTDPSLMPADRSAWSPINVLLSDSGSPRPMATMWLNQLHPALAHHEVNIFQTWNPLANPAPDSVITSSTFSRPVMCPTASKAANGLSALQGDGGVWMAGSYARYGLPLLENGVCSALDVVSRMGVPLPDFVDIPEPYGAASVPPTRSALWLVTKALVVVSTLAAATVTGLRWRAKLPLLPASLTAPLS